MNKTATAFTFALRLAAVLLLAKAVSAETYLIDTGPGGNSSIGSLSLFAPGSTSCGPQPSCQQNFQYLAGQIQLTQAVSVTSIEAWLGFGGGGAVDVRIREDVLGLPGTRFPPLFSPNSIYSKTYNVGSQFAPSWNAFTNYEAVLAAGTYWVSLEPVSNSQFNASMPGGATNPLPKYAFFDNGNPGYFDAGPAALGFRAAGTPFPGIALGTATRVILNGNAFGCCPVGPYDFIQSGRRDFAPIGVEGDPLTVSYIFVTPPGYCGANGRLFANGLSAGAFAANSGPCSGGGSCAVSAGRGVAFRTFTNMSTAARTVNFNAILDGRIGTSGGGPVFAGLYVFDPSKFSATISTSGVSYAEFLLRGNDLGDLAGGNEATLSLARLFPADAVLAKKTILIQSTGGNITNAPISVPYTNLPPGTAVTVMFDVSAYAADGGSAGFGDTLKPAADFITDTNGDPVPEIVALGPSAPPIATPAFIVLSPAIATNDLFSTHTVTGLVTTATGDPVADIGVVFTNTAGPNAGLSATLLTDAGGKASFTYSSNVAGTDSIQARIGALVSNTALKTWLGTGNSAPVAKCKNVTVPAGLGGTANASIDDGSFDPDSGDSITLVQVPAGPYAPGDTAVTLTVTDSHNASSSCMATVHVKGAADQITDLIALIRSFHLKAGTENALVPKLQDALKQLAKGQTKEACNNLNAFIKEVNNKQKDKSITAVQAHQMLTAATRIRAVLGC